MGTFVRSLYHAGCSARSDADGNLGEGSLDRVTLYRTGGSARGDAEVNLGEGSLSG